MTKQAKKPAKRADTKASSAGKPKRRKAGSKAKAKKAGPKAKPMPGGKPKPKALRRTLGFVIAAREVDWDKYIEAFEKGLKAKGWKINGGGAGDDRVDIIKRPQGGAAGDLDDINDAAQAFVDDSVDIIVTSGTQATLACMGKTSSIAIVFAAAGDPVGSGLVRRLTRPGGNVTGCSNLQTDDQVLKDRIVAMIAKLNPVKVGIIGNVDSAPVRKAIDLVWAELDGATPVATRRKGYFRPSDLTDRAAIMAKLKPLHDEGVDVLYVCSDPLLTSRLDILTDVAKHEFQPKMKTMHEIKERRGGDQTFGTDFEALFAKASEHADSIMRGTLPGNIDVFVPTAFVEIRPNLALTDRTIRTRLRIAQLSCCAIPQACGQA